MRADCGGRHLLLRDWRGRLRRDRPRCSRPDSLRWGWLAVRNGRSCLGYRPAWFLTAAEQHHQQDDSKDHQQAEAAEQSGNYLPGIVHTADGVDGFDFILIFFRRCGFHIHNNGCCRWRAFFLLGRRDNHLFFAWRITQPQQTFTVLRVRS